MIFLSIVLSVPDDMRAGKSILALTAVLGLWYGLGERRRFPGPAWTARSVAPSNGSSVPRRSCDPDEGAVKVDIMVRPVLLRSTL